MPVRAVFHWELILGREYWDNEKYENWKEEDFIKELKAVKEYFDGIKKKKLKMKDILEELKKSNWNFIIKKKHGMVKEIIEFTEIKMLVENWEFYRKTCKRYGRIWVAQDESHTGCFERSDEKCLYRPNQSNCPNYVPMAGFRPLKEIIESIDEWKIA